MDGIEHFYDQGQGENVVGFEEVEVEVDKPKPSIQCEDVNSFMQMMPRSALQKKAEFWDRDVALQVARAVGSVGMVAVKGSAKAVSLFHAFQEEVYARVDMDPMFQKILDPVYVVIRFQNDGPPPANWNAMIAAIPADYRGAFVHNNSRLFVMPSNGTTGREEARHFGGRLQECVPGLSFNVLVTTVPGNLYA